MDRREREALGSALSGESGNVRLDGFFSVQVLPCALPARWNCGARPKAGAMLAGMRTLLERARAAGDDCMARRFTRLHGAKVYNGAGILSRR